MRTVSKEVYEFEELSDSAKERARDWYRQYVFSDSNDWDHIFDDAAQCAEAIGLDIRTRQAKLMNGGVRWEPCIYFSGFWSQGDGACFEGNYRYKADAVATIKAHAPEDAELHRIAEALHSVPHPEGWSASTKHRGHYSHSGSMSVDVSFDDGVFDRDCFILGDDAELPQVDFTAGEETITQALRDFADWIYRQLEKEYEYQGSNECVDENITANEYEFNEDGTRA